MPDDLVTFLRARLDEDEVAAQAASPGPWIVRQVRDAGPIIEGGPGGYDEVVYPGNVRCGSYCYGGTSTVSLSDTDAAHIARHDPARVLADVAAKRGIIHEHPSDGMDGCMCGDRAPCPTLRHLAAVYASHPDYRQEWAP